jgi:DNA invertase Pin-like site-specific DNA recombinase
MFHVIAALAEFEPDSSNERTQAGFEVACASSRTGARLHAMEKITRVLRERKPSTQLNRTASPLSRFDRL